MGRVVAHVDVESRSIITRSCRHITRCVFMVKIISGEIVQDGEVGPSSTPLPNPWSSGPSGSNQISHQSGESQAAITGMQLGSFPLSPAAAAGSLVVGYLMMGIRGVLVVVMCLGFAMIKTEHTDSPYPTSGSRGGNQTRIGRTIADLPQTPSQGG